MTFDIAQDELHQFSLRLRRWVPGVVPTFEQLAKMKSEGVLRDYSVAMWMALGPSSEPSFRQATLRGVFVDTATDVTIERLTSFNDNCLAGLKQLGTYGELAQQLIDGLERPYFERISQNAGCPDAAVTSSDTVIVGIMTFWILAAVLGNGANNEEKVRHEERWMMRKYAKEMFQRHGVSEKLKQLFEGMERERGRCGHPSEVK